MSKPVNRARAKAVFERNSARLEYRKIEKKFLALLDNKIAGETGDIYYDLGKAKAKVVAALDELVRLDTLVRIYGDGNENESDMGSRRHRMWP